MAAVGPARSTVRMGVPTPPSGRHPAAPAGTTKGATRYGLGHLARSVDHGKEGKGRNRRAMTWSVATDVGRERKVNEDSVLAAPPTFVVADGMGGHDAGDVASAMVVERFSRIGGTQHLSAEQVTVAIDEANEAIFRAGSTTTERSMGTTAVGTGAGRERTGHSWVVFNVGDSRVYGCSKGSSRCSRWTTPMSRSWSTPDIRTADARSHPHRNVVTRALGVDQQSRPISGSVCRSWRAVPALLGRADR